MKSQLVDIYTLLDNNNKHIWFPWLPDSSAKSPCLSITLFLIEHTTFCYNNMSHTCLAPSLSTTVTLPAQRLRGPPGWHRPLLTTHQVPWWSVQGPLWWSPPTAWDPLTSLSPVALFHHLGFLYFPSKLWFFIYRLFSLPQGACHMHLWH